MVLIWDGSFIGDITEDIVHHGSVNYIRHCDGLSNINMTFTKVSIEKITNEVWNDLCLDVMKGVFYLPSTGFHICLIRTTTIDKDGSEITTRAKHCIRPLEHPIVSLGNETSIDKDLVKRLFAFAWIMGVRESLTEEIIEVRKINIGAMKPETEALIPGLKSGALETKGFGTSVPCVSDSVLRNWFGSSESPGLYDEENFYSYVREFVKPYRSATALKFRLDKILSIYFPDRKEENEKWMNKVHDTVDIYFKEPVVPKVPAPGAIAPKEPVVPKVPVPAPAAIVPKEPVAPSAIVPKIPAPTAIAPKALSVPIFEKVKEPSKKEKTKPTKATRLLPRLLSYF